MDNISGLLKAALILIMLSAPVAMADDSGLRELINEREKQMNLQIAAIRSELAVANKALEFRLAGMNEIRSQLSDQAATFLRKDEAKAQFEKLEMKVDMLQSAMAKREGSARWTDYMVTIAISAAVFLLLNLANGMISGDVKK
uniref:Uncharacterized protein n=2 Tax=viral metagenome TaxID=1070528 RepID=A0A6M3J358_9ZZZZ